VEKKPRIDEDLPKVMIEEDMSKVIEDLSKERPALHKNICQTWFEILRPEFGRPYFLKVCRQFD